MIPTQQLGQFGRSIVGGAAAPTWKTLFDWSANSVGSNNGWSGYTLRHVLNAAPGTGYPGLGGAGTKIRIQLRGGLVAGLSISKAYVGEAAASGDPYDFLTTPTQILWGGSASVSAAASTNTAVSDETTFVFDGTKKLVIALYFNGATNLFTKVGLIGAGSTTNYYVAGDSAATVNAASGQASTVANGVCKVEVYG